MGNDLKNQMENIGEMCDCSRREIVMPDRVVRGVCSDVVLQFHALRSWRAELMNAYEEVRFAKCENGRIVHVGAFVEESSPQEAVDTLLEYGKELIDRGFICVRWKDIEDRTDDQDDPETSE